MNNQMYPQSYVNRPYTQSNNITWVQGIEGAKAYQLMPNSNAILMDSENDGRFYIKVSDNVGMCTLRTFSYEEITSTPTTDMSQYVTKDELNTLIQNLLGGQTDEQSLPATKSKSKPLITK